MREHLFKAKRINDVAWVEGYFVKSYYKDEGRIACYIIGTESTYVDYEGFYPEDEVDPDTVCEYTGLTDKNDKSIFKNDIVKTKYGRLCKVIWFSSPRHCGYDLVPLEDKHKKPNDYDLFLKDNLEVVGNIFDNPKLIRGAEE